MGHESEKALNKRDKRKPTHDGSMPWQTSPEEISHQTWDDVDTELIGYVVRAVGGAGGSAQFTHTSDRGALGLRIYHDDHKTKTVWFRVGEGLEEAMYEIGDYYMAKAGKEPARWS